MEIPAVHGGSHHFQLPCSSGLSESFAVERFRKLGLLDFTGAGRIEGVSDLNVDAPMRCDSSW